MIITLVSKENEDTIYIIDLTKITYLVYRKSIWKSEPCLETEINFGNRDSLHLFKTDAEKFQSKFETYLSVKDIVK
jgi:hypothetical protein